MIPCRPPQAPPRIVSVCPRDQNKGTVRGGVREYLWGGSCYPFFVAPFFARIGGALVPADKAGGVESTLPIPYVMVMPSESWRVSLFPVVWQPPNNPPQKRTHPIPRDTPCGRLDAPGRAGPQTRPPSYPGRPEALRETRTAPGSALQAKGKRTGPWKPVPYWLGLRDWRNPSVRGQRFKGGGG